MYYSQRKDALPDAAQKTVLDAGNADQQRMKDELLTVEEACAFAKVDRSTIFRWRKNGWIRWIKFSSAQCSPVRIYADSFKAFLASKEFPSTQTDNAEAK